ASFARSPRGFNRYTSATERSALAAAGFLKFRILWDTQRVSVGRVISTLAHTLWRENQMIRADDPTTLSLLYHINSEPWDNTEAYEAAKDYEVEYKEMVGADGVFTLPAPSETPLMRLLQARESCRNYSLRPLPAQVLSNILACGYGIVRTAKIDPT